VTARQLEACLRMADAQGRVVVAQETDEGISGWSGSERPWGRFLASKLRYL
jgi:hypothetical protein